MRRGADVLADAVALTLGPRGRHVMLERTYGPPVATKDGVTVAKEIELAGKLENVAVQLVKAAASKTSDEAGDGTTTATVLARAILREGLGLVAAGHDPMMLRRGIEKAVHAVLAELRRLSKPIRSEADLKFVAAIAANNDAGIGELVGGAMQKVGREGVISVEEGHTFGDKLEFVEGIDFPRGYLSSHFVTDPERMEVNFRDCLILICDVKLTEFRQVLPFLETVSQAGRPLLVIADDVQGEALASLVTNKLKGAFACAAVKAPEFMERRRDRLQDIAIVTGAKVLSNELGSDLTKVAIEDMGRARQVVVSRDDTTIIGGAGEKAAVTARAEAIRRQLQNPSDEYAREKLEERLAQLTAGVAIIRVGGATEIDMKERMARLENAVMSVRAAAAEGILPGGGVALLRASMVLRDLQIPDEEEPGRSIVARALEAPARSIAANAGAAEAVVIAKIRGGKGGFGYNAAADRFEDLVACGVIDPTKVVRSALRNAVSVASLMLMTAVVITDAPEDESFVPKLNPPTPDMWK
jgi:chaperonin GroEL